MTAHREKPPRFEVTSLGEGLLRFNTSDGRRLCDLTSFEVRVGGAECNVCAALASLGRRVSWCSRLPQNPMGSGIAGVLEHHGVDLGSVVWAQQGRVGTYYLEQASGQRPGEVFYDRSGSAFTEMSEDELALETLFSTQVLHLTGITAALGERSRQLVEWVVARARDRSVPISFDINYRSKLWSAAQARAALPPLIQGAELLLCAQRDAEFVFGCRGDASEVARWLGETFAVRHCVLTRGDLGAVFWIEGQVVEIAAAPTRVVDSIGAGDAFAAGVLDGWLDGDVVAGLHRGVALAALALSRRGDLTSVSRPELEAAVADGGATPEPDGISRRDVIR